MTKQDQHGETADHGGLPNTIETITDDEPAAPVVEVEGTLTDLALVRSALLDAGVTLEVDPDAIAREIVERIIGADEGLDAFRKTVVWHADETYGRSFELRGVRWFPSSLENGPRVFATVDAVDLSTGERGLLTTSAYKQLAQLFVAARDKLWPLRVMNVQADRPTAAGYYPLEFELIEQAPEA